MASKVYVEPADVWGYYINHQRELEHATKVLAERKEFGVEVWLMDDQGFPYVMVVADDEDLEAETILTAKDCAETVSMFYDTYLSDSYMHDVVDEVEEYSTSDMVDMIEERESELDTAVWDMLEIIVQNIAAVSEDPDKLCEDIKDHICEYLFKKHKISVYRPMFLECEDGTDEFFKFPYDEMDF